MCHLYKKLNQDRASRESLGAMAGRAFKGGKSMKDVRSFDCIYLCVSSIDFRKGIFSLSALVESQFQQNPFEGGLFIFTNKKKDSLKALYWDKTGFALWTKILDKEKFPWPKCPDQTSLLISQDEMEFLLKGINPWKLKKHTDLNYFIA